MGLQTKNPVNSNFFRGLGKLFFTFGFFVSFPTEKPIEFENRPYLRVAKLVVTFWGQTGTKMIKKRLFLKKTESSYYFLSESVPIVKIGPGTYFPAQFEEIAYSAYFLPSF